MYRTDIKSALFFILVMAASLWVVPEIVCFMAGDKAKYDGELMIKDVDEENINYILRIYDLQTMPLKDELYIKVSNKQFED
jgi:hypothetical protein